MNYPANIYLFKVNNRNTRKRYEIYPNLIKNIRTVSMTPFSCVTPLCSVSVVDFEQVNVS